MSYSYYSNDEEEFHGSFETREHALDEAILNYPDYCVLYTAENIPAKDMLLSRAKRIGEIVYEGMVDTLYDEVGEAVDYFVINEKQKDELGKMIIRYIDTNIGFNCWGLKKTMKHRVENKENRIEDQK